MSKQFTIQISPTIKQGLCWDRLKDNTTQFILFGGGANGGKSWLGCEWLTIMSIANPGTKWFIGRNELKRLMVSTYITFRKVCAYHNIPSSSWKLNSKLNYIEFWNGSRIDLLDVAYKPSDPLYERFGSTEYTGGWLEEVGEIHFQAYDVLKSRIGRCLNDEYNISPKILCTCNPKKNWLYYEFYKPDKEGTLSKDSCFIKSLYTDNPYAPKDYGETLSKIKDPILRARLKDGIWEYDDNDAILMNYDKILNMFTNKYYNENLEDDFYVTCDVARFGRDKAVIILWEGHFMRKIWYYDKSSCAFLKKKIEHIVEQYYVPWEKVVVDADGIGGGGVIDYLPNEVVSFLNGAAAIVESDDDPKYRLQESKKYSFKNLRSQCYFKLSELVNTNIIGCYDGVDLEVRNWIIEELEAIKRKDVDNNESKMQVISKDEIKKTILRSPDFGDSMMMRCIFDVGVGAADVDVEIAW